LAIFEKKDKFKDNDLGSCTNVIFVDQHLEIEYVISVKKIAAPLV
jgi:hypothetical protein